MDSSYTSDSSFSDSESIDDDELSLWSDAEANWDSDEEIDTSAETLLAFLTENNAYGISEPFKTETAHELARAPILSTKRLPVLCNASQAHQDQIFFLCYQTFAHFACVHGFETQAGATRTCRKALNPSVESFEKGSSLCSQTSELAIRKHELQARLHMARLLKDASGLAWLTRTPWGQQFTSPPSQVRGSAVWCVLHVAVYRAAAAPHGVQLC